MKKYLIFISLFFIFNCTFGQEKLPRPKMKIKDTGLNEFMTQLKVAVSTKDMDYIISVLSPDILNSFGGSGGIEEFKTYWNSSTDDSPFWGIMERLIKLGGGKYKGNGFYKIPYVSSNWPGGEKYNGFEHMAITGTNVNVRINPQLKTSEVVGQFSFDIVKVDYEKSISSSDETIWYYTESLDGKLKGFVFRDYIWSPIGYRANFELLDGKWKMTIFVAGD